MCGSERLSGMDEDLANQLLLVGAAVAIVYVVIRVGGSGKPPSAPLPATSDPAPSQPARRAEATVAFEYLDGWTHWTVAFDVMRAWMTVQHPRVGSFGSVEHYIRRVAPSEWEMRLTELAWAQQREDLKAAVRANEGPTKIAALLELGPEGREPEWIPFGLSMSSVLETQFHIFVQSHAARRRAPHG